ncbi:MAG: AAA family ATPase [Nitrospinae bacterium]|nr:AAA family ATPase [Nitrospinota bacterium]
MEISLTGYSVSHMIAETTKSIIYRGYSEALGKNVIIKALAEEYPSNRDIARINHEFEILSMLDINGVTRVLAKETQGNNVYLIFEDAPGESLDKLLDKGILETPDFLRFALSIAGILGEVHRKNVIHKDIKPKNILFHKESNQTTVIDFGLASVLGDEDNTGININLLEGTLNFISPEQTGRMNRSVDYRTDLYSLGVTLYRAVTGKLPFHADDPMELVHCHIAKKAAVPSEIDGNIPSMVSAIIMKLLEKNAEDRYQNAYGLKADLEECIKQLRENGSIKPFTLGMFDISESFHIPQKLYGREGEILEIMKGFKNAARGLKDILLISGDSGVGKSALVNEIYKPVVEGKGNFISGKFDQFKRDIPYNALLQALEKLIKQILTEEEENFAYWKENLLVALGQNGQVIIDFIPEVELVIGKQLPVPTLPPNEAHNRFLHVFQSFFRAFARKLHPLVVFLDDLQWADMATLKLLEALVPQQETRYLFLIGAYRGNEVAPEHPLQHSIEKIEGEIGLIEKIIVNPLKQDDVSQLIADTLKCGKESIGALSSLIYEKTSGNPFFVNQFLRNLYDEKILSVDTGTGRWEWDINKVKDLPSTDNVLDLMASKIDKLPPESRNTLQYAAAIGSRFDLHTLSVIEEKTLLETARSLLETVENKLILPISTTEFMFFLNTGKINEGSSYPELRFLHDRIQQAAYSLVEEQHKEEVHVMIARHLSKNLSEKETGEHIFDIVNHFSRGKSLITDDEEALSVAQLSLTAGKKAKLSSAHEQAFTYILLGVELLGEKGWKQHFNLTLELHNEGAETAYLNHDFESMESFIQGIEKNVTNPFDLVKCSEIKIRSCTAQNLQVEAVNVALEILGKLGLRISPNPSDLAILWGYVRIRSQLVGMNFDDLMDHPEMTDPNKLAMMSILITIGTAAYLANPKVVPMLVFAMVNLTLKYGNSPYATYTYQVYGFLLSGIFGNIKLGYQFSVFSLELAEKRYSKELFLKGKSLAVFNLLVMHSKEHFSSTLDSLAECFRMNLETGDYESASNTSTGHAICLFFAGRELGMVEKETLKYIKILKRIKQGRGFVSSHLGLICVQSLNGKIDDIENFNIYGYSEEKFTDVLTQSEDIAGLIGLDIFKGIACYFCGKYELAAKCFMKAENKLESIAGLFHLPIYFLFASLSHLAVANQRASKKVDERKVRSNQRKLKKLAENAPMNFLHMYHLVEAELGKYLGNDQKAERLYDLAISEANENGFLNIESLANELAAKYYFDKGRKKVGKTYLIDAHYCYKKWGAAGKVEQLEREYPDILRKIIHEPDMSISLQGSVSSSVSESLISSSGENRLDIFSVIKASRSLSQEISIEKLLVKLIGLLIENAGAQRGILMLDKEGELVLEVESSVDDREVQMLNSVSPEENTDLIPLSVINFVNRTHKEVILNDVLKEGQFMNDPYFKDARPKSVLCMPIIHQTRLVGILYLENKLAAGAFTPQLLETLQILASQAAVSIENASFYSSLEERVKTRTEELSKTLEDLRFSQEKLVQAEKMASLGGLVAGLAHEINTPIGIGVTAASHLFGETEEIANTILEGQLKKSSLDKYIETCKASSSLLLNNLQRTAELINSFKLVSADQQSFDTRTFKVVEYLCEVVNSLSPETKKRDVTVSIKAPEEYTIDSYPGAFAQIITNLVTNSLTHAFEPDKKGNILIEISKQEKSLQTIFTDNGKGIPPEDLGKIFEPFYTTKRNQGGTGLGLHIIYNLIHQKLEGTISCKSSPGKGTTFIITIPME